MRKSSKDYGVTNFDEGGKDALASLPHLADRVADFEKHLLAEPCQRLHERTFSSGCTILSNTNSMCAPCRLRILFFHCTYNGEMYRTGLGEDD